MSTLRRYVIPLRGATAPRPPLANRAGREGFGPPHVFRVRRFGGGQRRRGRTAFLYSGALIVLVLLLLAGLILGLRGSISSSGEALGAISLPFGGGRILRVKVYHGPHSATLPIKLSGGQLWPQTAVNAGEPLMVEALIKRAGWVSWLGGSTERLRLTLRTPRAYVKQQFLTLPKGAPLTVSFSQPVQAVEYGPALGALKRLTLSSPKAVVELPRSGAAGSFLLVGLARRWERSPLETVSWFPTGSGAQAVVSPAPGSLLRPGTPITITFSEPVSHALGGNEPVVSPHVEGRWRTVSSHAVRFYPSGYGYGLGQRITVALPSAIRVVGGEGGQASTASWQVPGPSTLRLQELLAELDLLPLSFRADTAVADTPLAQEEAAVAPPSGTFSWRYPNVPPTLRNLWAPGRYGVMTKGAVMAFEDQRELYTFERYEESTPDPGVWRALIEARLAQWRSSFGYSFVTVVKSLQQLQLWHNGKVIITTPVNTGIEAAPTETGVFTVYEHLRSTTMSGTAPGGVHYEDPGVPWVSYFNGGDALHGFERSTYGVPQSLGCVEMPPATAAAVWPYTPIGTLVDVAE